MTVRVTGPSRQTVGPLPRTRDEYLRWRDQKTGRPTLLLPDTRAQEPALEIGVLQRRVMLPAEPIQPGPVLRKGLPMAVIDEQVPELSIE